MSQHVIVTSNTSVDLKPLLESAIRDEVRLLELSLFRTVERLQAFEAQYAMTSEVFMQRFEAGELRESLDYIEWAGEIKTYSLLHKQQQALQNAHVQ